MKKENNQKKQSNNNAVLNLKSVNWLVGEILNNQWKIDYIRIVLNRKEEKNDLNMII